MTAYTPTGSIQTATLAASTADSVTFARDYRYAWVANSGVGDVYVTTDGSTPSATNGVIVPAGTQRGIPNGVAPQSPPARAQTQTIGVTGSSSGTWKLRHRNLWYLFNWNDTAATIQNAFVNDGYTSFVVTGGPAQTASLVFTWKGESADGLLVDGTNLVGAAVSQGSLVVTSAVVLTVKVLGSGVTTPTYTVEGG